jgi:hypothetical protein
MARLGASLIYKQYVKYQLENNKDFKKSFVDEKSKIEYQDSLNNCQIKVEDFLGL